MLIRITCTITCLMVAVMMSGCCCGPTGGCGGGGFGGGCVTNCNDCDGTYYGGFRGAPCGPFQHLNQIRKSLVCGGGCGEVYYGEWQSTPPDACDPCASGQFTGGAVPCNPFCWRPGFLFGFFGNFWGHRYGGCGGGVPCGGGGCGGGCGCDGGFSGGGYVDNGYIDGGFSGGGGGGCSTCNASTVSPNIRQASPINQQNPNTIRHAQTKVENRTARVVNARRGVSSRYPQGSGTTYR